MKVVAKGRADLVRLLASLPESEWKAAARALDFVPKEETNVSVAGSDKDKEKGSTRAERSFQGGNVPTETYQPADLPDWYFWRIARIASEEPLPPQGKETPSWLQSLVPSDHVPGSDSRVPRPEQKELISRSRQARFFRRHLAESRNGRDLDSKRLCAMLAERRLPSRLPRLPCFRWPMPVHLVIDLSPSLRPYWEDFFHLEKHLRRILGKRVQRWITRSGNPRDAFRARAGGERQPLQDGMLVLLSDAGLYPSGGVRQRHWLEFGREYASRVRRILLIAPVPPRFITSEISRIFKVVLWDLGANLHPQKGGYQTGADGPGILPAGSQKLLYALANASRVEPPLLRELRLLLGEQGTDIGSEYEVWNHPHVRSNILACTLDKEHRPDVLADFRQLSPELQGKIATKRYKLNRHQSPLIQAEEVLADGPLASADAENSARELLRDLAASLHKGSDPKINRELAGYLVQVISRRPELLSQSRELATAWAIARREELKAGTLGDIPAGVELADVQWLMDEEVQPRRTFLAQIGDRVGLFPEEQAQPACRFTSAVLDSPYWQIEPAIDGAEEDTAPQLLTLGESLALSPQRRYHLSLGNKRLELEVFRRPSWAVGMGRDRDGLFVELPDSRRAYWVSKGSVMSMAREKDRLAPTHMGYFLPHGFWWDEAEFRIWLEAGRCLPYPPWASAISGDQYGLHAAFQVNGVGQNMRWIPPGEFLMGSPQTEPEREPWGIDETQHPVMLTQGFWLAESACTQALWQAVMDESPSGFQGAERPVERVSWNDIVERFLPALNRLVPGLEAGLPGEAQWEYACRAGTTTPFWFGDNITPDQVNYDGNYPYAKGRKGQYREKTVEAKALPANGWGLYQMHGNVWEWCADWLGEYPRERVIDPAGPPEGRRRVLRGGGWVGFGGDCRSAYRDAFVPGHRDRGRRIGFRLARGHSPHRAGSVVEGGVAAGGSS